MTPQTTDLNKSLNPLTRLKKAPACYDESINIMNKSSLDKESRQTLAYETQEELAERRKRYSELVVLLQEQIENGDAEYDERVGRLLEKELATAL